MASQWFIHIQGETVGPMSQSALEAMLKQNRLQFADFVWSQDLTKWARVFDLDEFAHLLPGYPKVPIPKAAKAAKPAAVESDGEEEVVEEVPAPKAAKKKAALKAVEPPPEAEEEEVVPAPVTAKKPREEFAEAPPPVPHIKAKAVAQQKSWPKFRRFIRVPIEATLNIQEHGKFDAQDISEGGVFLETKNDLPLGSEVRFVLHAGVFGKPFEMTGVVIRLGKESEKVGFAIEFVRVNPAHRRAITSYVEEFLKKNQE